MARANGLPPVFWALCAGAGLARLGWLLIPFRAIYLTQERHLTAAQAALVMAAFGAGWALALPIGGVLADRIGRRAVIVGSSVANAGACLLFGAATTVSWLVLTGFLAGMTFDLFRPAAQALAADIAGEHRLARAIALLFWVMNVARCVACFAGGLLAQQHIPLLFVACASVSLLFAVIMWATLPAATPSAGRDRRMWRTSIRDKQLIWFTAATAGFFTIYMQSVVTLPAALSERGITPLQLGMILSASPLLVALAQPLYLNRLHRLPPKTVAAAAVAATGAGLALTGTAANATWAAAFTPIWVAGDIVFLAVAAGLVAAMAPAARRGTYLGIWASAHGIGALAAPPLAAAVIAAAGPSLLWASSAAGGLLLAALVLRLNLTDQQAPSAAQSQPGAATTRPDHGRVLAPARTRRAVVSHISGHPPKAATQISISVGPRLAKAGITIGAITGAALTVTGLQAWQLPNLTTQTGFVMVLCGPWLAARETGPAIRLRPALRPIAIITAAAVVAATAGCTPGQPTHQQPGRPATTADSPGRPVHDYFAALETRDMTAAYALSRSAQAWLTTDALATGYQPPSAAHVVSISYNQPSTSEHEHRLAYVRMRYQLASRHHESTVEVWRDQAGTWWINSGATGRLDVISPSSPKVKIANVEVTTALTTPRISGGQPAAGYFELPPGVYTVALAAHPTLCTDPQQIAVPAMWRDGTPVSVQLNPYPGGQPPRLCGGDSRASPAALPLPRPRCSVQPE